MPLWNKWFISFYCSIYIITAEIILQLNIFMHAAITLQEPARLLQHLFYFIPFYFILLQTSAQLQLNTIKHLFYCNICFIQLHMKLTYILTGVSAVHPVVGLWHVVFHRVSNLSCSLCSCSWLSSSSHPQVCVSSSIDICLPLSAAAVAVFTARRCPVIAVLGIESLVCPWVTRVLCDKTKKNVLPIF